MITDRSAEQGPLTCPWGRGGVILLIVPTAQLLHIIPQENIVSQQSTDKMGPFTDRTNTGYEPGYGFSKSEFAIDHSLQIQLLLRADTQI